MPNAGHTYVDNNGGPFVSKIVPLGALFCEDVIIGPHAVFDLDRFELERNMFLAVNPDCKIWIHPLATVLKPEDSASEARDLNHIASTMQGSCASVMSKMKRNPENCRMAKNESRLTEHIADTHELLNSMLNTGRTGLAETAQGFDLGLNHGMEWPFTTSRDCLVGRVLDNAGVSPKLLGSIVASLRTYPIRVGNTKGGFSGPHYPDQKELSWKKISEWIGYAVEEKTTVTKRVRRVFTWSDQQIARYCRFVKPDYAFLNFVNYYTDANRGIELRRIEALLRSHGCELALLGTGPAQNDVIEKRTSAWNKAMA